MLERKVFDRGPGGKGRDDHSSHKLRLMVIKFHDVQAAHCGTAGGKNRRRLESINAFLMIDRLALKLSKADQAECVKGTNFLKYNLNAQPTNHQFPWMLLMPSI